MRNNWHWTSATGLLGLLALGGCVDAYLPDVVEAPNRYLVVDGFINGNGVTRIRLSRSVNVAATTAPSPEIGDKVLIVDETGRTYSLTERSPGLYQSDSLLLPANRRYHLRLSVGGGANPAVYESAAVPLKVTPAIDRLNWRLLDGKVLVQVSTHDASAQARYYRWRTVETWEFHVPILSKIEFLNGVMLPKRVTPIYTCWRTEVPSDIRQATTAQLGADAVSDFQLFSFSPLSERFETRYSALVSQYAETAEEFAYNEQLRKNTEAVGTVNDPLPVQLAGNVHRTNGNTAEPVLGYVGAHTVQQQRLFINNTDLTVHPFQDYDTPYKQCAIQDTAEILFPFDKFGANFPDSRVFRYSGNVPIDFIAPPSGPTPYGYSGASRECADCRVRGTNVKPSYW